MNSSPSDSNGVHLGLWTNWSRGSVFGATLTLTQSNANLLIAFVSFFVTYVGTRFWRIGCLVLHFAYSSRAPRDGLYHQRQAILRNASNAEDGLYTLLCLAWVWRRIARHTLYRIIPVLCFTTMCVVGWTLAAGFSSKLSTSVGNEVLLIGSNCGVLDQELHSNAEDIEAFLNPYTAKLLNSAATYAQQCYSGQASDSQYCTTYVQKSLNSTILTNATCPFDKKICQNDDANVFIDTGYLNSHDHFGINAPEKERFEYRRVLHCAPLTAENYTVQHNVSSDKSFTRYMYGPGLDWNWTYQYTNDAQAELINLNGSGQSYDYDLGARSAYYFNGSLQPGYHQVYPIPELRRPEADFTLIFISANKIAYTSPITDPWFHATTPLVPIATRPGNDKATGGLRLYRQDQPASAMGCTLQHQFCLMFPEGRRCSDLGGSVDSMSAMQELFSSHSKAMLNRLEWLFSVMDVEHLDIIVNTMGSASLLTKLGLTIGSVGRLPDNQWQLEVKNWHDISTTQLQAMFVNAAKGLNDATVSPWVRRPNSTEAVKLCNSQKINSTQFASFSVFGLLMTFVLGGLIMLVSYTLEPMIACIWGRGKTRHYSQMEWRLNETLQLQRLAHEMRGRGTWARTADFIPVTKASEDLAPLDFTDPGHPVLRDDKDVARAATFSSDWTVSPPSSADDQDKEKV